MAQITKVLRVIVAECQNTNNGNSSFEEIDALEVTMTYNDIVFSFLFLLTFVPCSFESWQEARMAIEQVVIPKRQAVDLLPRPAHIILAQTVFLQKYKLSYEKVGQEPNIHLRVLPVHSETNSSSSTVSDDNEDDGSIYNSVPKLPFLPS